MTAEKVRFIVLPQFLFLDKTLLKYQDVLIYLVIRSFLNTMTDCCFPSYETIAKRAGVSRDFVIKSVKRLKAQGIIIVKSRRRKAAKHNPNIYSFESTSYAFEMIPYSFLEVKDLSYSAKAMLLCIRQFFNFGVLTCGDTITGIARNLGLTYKMVHAQLVELADSGYVQVCNITRGAKKYKRLKLTDRINWIYGQTKDSYTNSQVKCLSIKVA